jgi:two-component system KDP operon response regulator KdpE
VKGKRILVVDDDHVIRGLVRAIFEREGAEVYEAGSGREALDALNERACDLVILDVMMPGMDGWQTCALLREFSDAPIIFLTVRSTVDDIIHGLDVGAVDYVTKPFFPQVLLARARAALRQAEAPSGEQTVGYDDGYLAVDLDGRRALREGEVVPLTTTEYRLLVCLLEDAGRVLSHRQILETVWGREYGDSVNYVHVYVRHLREKLEPDPSHPRYFLSERGVGYRFQPHAGRSAGARA